MSERNSKQIAYKEAVKPMENTYWCIAHNIIEEIQKQIPEITRSNPETSHILDAWDTFKNDPCENTFSSFILAFRSYGNDKRWN